MKRSLLAPVCLILVATALLPAQTPAAKAFEKRLDQALEALRTAADDAAAGRELAALFPVLAGGDEARKLASAVRASNDPAAARSLLGLSIIDGDAQVKKGTPTPMVEPPLPAEWSDLKAAAIVERVRRPGCALAARSLLFDEVPGLRDDAACQKLVAALREAPDARAATVMLTRAGRESDAPASDCATPSEACGAEACAASCETPEEGWTFAKASSIATRVRHPGCATIAKSVILNEVPGLKRDPAACEALVAAVREAPDSERATLIIERAAHALDREKAQRLARAVRRPGCATVAKSLLFNEIPALGSVTRAEALVARVREAPSEAVAVAELIAAASQPVTAVPAELVSFPEKLSRTGLYDDTAALAVAKGFVAYEVNAPLWSDDAKKDRFLRLPPGTAIDFRADGSWSFPVGTTFFQTLRLDVKGERLYTETRVIVQGKDELQFATYLWDEDQKDATLTRDGDQIYANVGGSSQTWSVTKELDCAKCHNDAAGLILGVNAAQLHRTTGEGAEPQLRRLAKAGVLRGLPETLESVASLPDPYDAARPLEERARAYLHVNCSNCHRPGGPGSGTLDLRFDTPEAETGLLMSKNHAGRRGVVRPGRAHYSQLFRRMHSLSWDRMPSLQSTVPDERALELIREWIESMDDGKKKD